MKRYFTPFIIAVLAIGSAGMLGSCNKTEDDPAGGGGTKSNSMTATIGTKALNTGTMIVEYGSNGYIDITSNDKDQATVLSVNFDINGPNTQSINGVDAFAAVQLSSQEKDLYTAESGTLTITNNNKDAGIVEGTFTFTGRNTLSETISVTGGTFYAKYDK